MSGQLVDFNNKPIDPPDNDDSTYTQLFEDVSSVTAGFKKQCGSGGDDPAPIDENGAPRADIGGGGGILDSLERVFYGDIDFDIDMSPENVASQPMADIRGIFRRIGNVFYGNP